MIYLILISYVINEILGGRINYCRFIYCDCWSKSFGRYGSKAANLEWQREHQLSWHSGHTTHNVRFSLATVMQRQGRLVELGQNRQISSFKVGKKIYSMTLFQEFYSKLKIIHQ